MGFFKDFKNDMKQAVNELIPGNEEMANEYDDEDMVNTLEEAPDDNEYINTMDESSEGKNSQSELKADRKSEYASEDDLDDIDLDDIDIDEAELEEESARYESDMASLAALLSGNTTIEDVKKQESSSPEEQSNEELETDAVKEEEQEIDIATEEIDDTKGKTDVEELADTEKSANIEKNANVEEPVDINESAEASKEEAEPLEKEKAEMTDDKIIDITSIKEPEPIVKQDVSEVHDAKTPKSEEEISDSTTYITQGTRIEGNIFTDGSVDLLGTVEGDVNCYGKLIVSGSIAGKVNAGEIYANAARIEGEIISAGSVKIGVGSVIVGNIDAQSAVIAGAVNGEVDVKGPVIVDSTAVIMGNIKSRSVQINNGAVIEGFCSQCYSDIDVKSFFA